MGQCLFIPLVRDSIIIIGSRSIYTFGSRFTYKRWAKVLSKIWILAFLGKYSNIFVGSQSMSIEVRNIFQYFCWVSKRVYWGSHQRVTQNQLSLSILHKQLFILPNHNGLSKPRKPPILTSLVDYSLTPNSNNTQISKHVSFSSFLGKTIIATNSFSTLKVLPYSKRFLARLIASGNGVIWNTSLLTSKTTTFSSLKPHQKQTPFT